MKRYFLNMPDDLGKKYEQFTYPAGETQVRLKPQEATLAGMCDHVVITARINDGNLMPLALMANAFDSNNGFLILPYLPYGRADRPFVHGDCFGLSVFSQLLSTCRFSRIITFDAHSKVSHRLYFGGKFIDVPPTKVIQQVLSNFDETLTILLPDKGSVSRYNKEDFGSLQVSTCSKIREKTTGKLSGFEVPIINSKKALIVDDICDGGGTFIGIAEKIKETQPDVKLYLYVSHGIFSQGFEKLAKNFEHIYTTDSIYGKVYSGSKDLVTKFPIEGLLRSSFMTTEELFQQTEEK